MINTKYDILKEIEKVIVKLEKLGWDGVCRVNEFNVHTYKYSELRGFLNFYSRELNNLIIKQEREEYWETDEGAQLKYQLESEIEYLEYKYEETSQNFTLQLKEILNKYFDENWIIKYYKDNISIGLKNENEEVPYGYWINIRYKKDFSKESNGRLNILLDEINEFNSITNNMRPIFFKCLYEFLLDNDAKTEILFILKKWSSEYNKFYKSFKNTAEKLRNPLKY